MDRVEAMVRDARSRCGSVAVAGFSQGGAVALAMAWRGTSADHVIAMCSFFPETDADLVRGGSSSTRVMVLSTDGDEEVPAFMGVDAASMFESQGFHTRAHTLAGTHHVDADLAATARSFIAEVDGRRPAYSLALPVERVDPPGEFTSAEAIAELAVGYESLGFDAAYVTDHPAPDDRWLAGGGHHALDPIGALGVAAAVTSDLLLHTNVYVLPYRNPLLAAKSLATLDVISTGRAVIGVAAGYLRPEFRALGADFEKRGELLDEALGVMPSVWTGRTFASAGTGWEARSATVRPPTYGGPPVWVGGNSRAAVRRSVTMAQGWSPMPTPKGSGSFLRTAEIPDAESLSRRIASVHDLCEETGRVAPLTICFVPFALGGYLQDPGSGLAPMVEEIADLFERGVDWFPLMVPGSSRAEVLENCAALADALRGATG